MVDILIIYVDLKLDILPCNVLKLILQASKINTTREITFFR